MLGKTHMAVGVAASLLLLQPRTLPELILGAGAAAVGSVISDIDCGTSESSRRADQIIFVSETIIIGIAAVEAHWHLGLYQRLMSNSSVSHIVLACAAFLAVCAYGKKTPHRSFLHSFLAGGLLMSCVGVFLPMLVPYFGIAYASHLALDFLNHKGEQLLYPYRKRFSLGICSASGLVNRLCSVLRFCCVRGGDAETSGRHDFASIRNANSAASVISNAAAACCVSCLVKSLEIPKI